MALNAGIQLQALNRTQINRYLSVAGGSPQLRAALLSERQTPLHELAASPMMLSLLREMNGSEGLADAPLALISAFVNHAFDRKPMADAGKAKIRQQLSWLARHMRQNNQSLFLIEEMQPSWLDHARHRLLYKLINQAILSLISVAVFGNTLIYVWYRSNFTLKINYFDQIAGWLGTRYEFGIFAGLSAISLLILLLFLPGEFQRWEAVIAGNPPPIKNKIREPLLQAGLIFTLTALPIALFGDVAVGVGLGFIVGLSRVGSSQTWLAGASYQTDIQPSDAIGWSWGKAGLGILIGLLHGLVWIWAVPNMKNWWDLPMLAGFFLFVLGLQGKRIETKSQPNLGSWLALRNGLFTGALLGGIFALAVALYESWAAALWWGSALFLCGFLIQGGLNGVKHLVLRLLLWVEADVPIRYAKFLENAGALGFFGRAGGGYAFRHRLFLDYFAN